MPGQPHDLPAADPDIARPAGATVAALRAGEIQPGRVPALARLQNVQFHGAPPVVGASLTQYGQFDGNLIQ